MKGKFVFQKGLREKDPELESVVSDLPIKAGSGPVVINERRESVELPLENLRYFIGEYEFPEEQGMRVYGIYQMRGHPELDGVSMYDGDQSSEHINEMNFCYANEKTVSVIFRNRVFCLRFDCDAHTSQSESK